MNAQDDPDQGRKFHLLVAGRLILPILIIALAIVVGTTQGPITLVAAVLGMLALALQLTLNLRRRRRAKSDK